MDTEKTIVEAYIYDLILNAPAYVTFTIEERYSHFYIISQAGARKTRVVKLNKKYRQLTEELINRTR